MVVRPIQPANTTGTYGEANKTGTGWCGPLQPAVTPPPLHASAQDGNQHMVVRLIRAGADLGAGDWLNDTPLHAAACHGHQVRSTPLPLALPSSPPSFFLAVMVNTKTTLGGHVQELNRSCDEVVKT